MVQTTEIALNIAKPLSQIKKEARKGLKVMRINYRNNLDSDYTEKIKEIDQSFNYSQNSKAYWTDPKQSLLYGTPLYEQASEAQKIALNHLFWVSKYNYTAYSETETIDYNLITADCFRSVGQDFEFIAQQLEHESAQEKVHIHAFWKVNYQTMKALLGKQAFTNRNASKNKPNYNPQLEFSNYQYQALKALNRVILPRQDRYVSPYLEKLKAEKKLTSITTRGFFHGRGITPRSLVRFFADSWGSSPFLACQYYTIRFIANMLLKNQEHSISLYFKKLQKQDDFMPAPTALSYYHFLDESFHTTTSLFLSRDVYKNFPRPTIYEKVLINWAVYLVQKINLGHISAVLRNRFFGDDSNGMNDIYRMFRSPLFEMSADEALQWLEKCYCQEHEGFHQSAESHQKLRSEASQLCSELDYLWPVNRELRLMKTGNSIDQALKNNAKTFRGFAQTVSQDP